MSATQNEKAKTFRELHKLPPMPGAPIEAAVAPRPVNVLAGIKEPT